jgi:hypothetical protein
MKKPTKVLHYFGLWDVRILQTLCSRAVIQRKIVDSPAFLYRFAGKDCCLCNPSAEEVGGLEVFLYEPAQNFELFSNIQNQN